MPTNPFKVGNKLAEKWTPAEVEKVLQKVWETLTKPEESLKADKKQNIPAHPDYGNYVRHNDIKTINECLLMNGLTKWWWSDIKNRYREMLKPKDTLTEAANKKSRKAAMPVLLLMDLIESVLEARLIYGGTGMDMFILKNKYGYYDSHTIDHTTKGGAVTPPTGTSHIEIPADRLTDEQIAKFIDGRYGGAGNTGTPGLIGGL